jgi:hypothetical protein
MRPALSGAALLRVQQEGGAAVGSQFDPGGAHVGVRRLTEGGYARGGALTHRGDQRIVCVEHGQAVLGQRLDQFALG